MQAIETGAQQTGRTGVVLQQLSIFAEADQERQILLAQYGAEELRRGVLFDIDQVHLTGADIDEQADGEGQIGFVIEILDLLLLAVFEDCEIALI